MSEEEEKVIKELYDVEEFVANAVDKLYELQGEVPEKMQDVLSDLCDDLEGVKGAILGLVDSIGRGEYDEDFREMM